jgi:hypothetical protein
LPVGRAGKRQHLDVRMQPAPGPLRGRNRLSRSARRPAGPPLSPAGQPQGGER